MAKKSFQVNDLIATLEEYFKKAPALPENIRETLARIAPWIALIFGVLGVLGGLAAVGVSPIATLGGVRDGTSVLISGVFAIVSSVMMLMAYPKLTKRQTAGWTLLFWSEVVSLISSLLAGAILGGVIAALIGFYLLFQIKSYYK